MPQFSIVGVRKSDGSESKCNLTADDEQAALMIAKEQGLYPTSVHEIAEREILQASPLADSTGTPTHSENLARKSQNKSQVFLICGVGLLLIALFSYVHFANTINENARLQRTVESNRQWNEHVASQLPENATVEEQIAALRQMQGGALDKATVEWAKRRADPPAVIPLPMIVLLFASGIACVFAWAILR